MKYKVFYMQDYWFPWGIIGTQPDPSKLDVTHVPLVEVELLENGTPNANLQHIFNMMQAEVWDAEGKAGPELAKRNIAHTSMSVGDIIIDPDAMVHVVAKVGFNALGKVSE